jgi:hypothetical protein
MLDVCRCAYGRRTPKVVAVRTKKLPPIIQKRKPREKYDLLRIKMKAMQEKDYHIILLKITISQEPNTVTLSTFLHQL